MNLGGCTSLGMHHWMFYLFFSAGPLDAKVIAKLDPGDFPLEILDPKGPTSGKALI